jgi:hypothetical protein
VCWASGLYGAITGAKIAVMTSSAMTAMPTAPVGLRSSRRKMLT